MREGSSGEDCCLCLPCPAPISSSFSSRQKHPNFPLGNSLFPSLTPRFQASICDLRYTISLKTGITSGMDMCPCQFNRVYPKLLLELLGKRVSKQIGCKSRILLLSNLSRGQICLRVKPTQRGKKLRDRDRVLMISYVHLDRSLPVKLQRLLLQL